MKYYHGTSNEFADDIEANGIDFTKGEGELGKGFYVGDYAHIAFAYAWHKFSNEKKGCSILEYNINDTEFVKLNVLTLGKEMVNIIDKKYSKQMLGCDAIMADGVRNDGSNHRQIKFERETNCLQQIERYDVTRK